jgi:cell division protein FtsI/penicillin-binding protein 2
MRFKVIRIAFYLIIFTIILRLGYWQIIRNDDLTAMAEGQRVTSREISGLRGDILFSDGSVLASNKPTYRVYVQPPLIKELKKLSDNEYRVYAKTYAGILATFFWEEEHKSKPISSDERIKQILDLEGSIQQKITQDLSWISINKEIDLEQKKRLEDLNLPGLGYEQNSARLYPEGSSSAHLLGFVAADVYGNEKGYFGLEGFYDGELRGKKGVVTEEKDALGLPILIGKFLAKQPKDGKTLNLTIDRSVQYIVEEKLKKGLEKYGAKGVSAIIMEPKSGNILAMASLPSYDPLNPGDYPKESYRNPITADGYEPGSTFKVLVMAAGMNEDLVEPDTKCDICAGPLQIGQYSIRTWNNKYQKDATMTDVIIHSDNTGMVFTGRKLGVDKMYDYLRKFGFGDNTGIDLQDESSPELREKSEWREIDLATSSFGQGISVTALQVVRAVASIANGGKLMEPHMVSAIKEGEDVFSIKPRVISEPITPDTAKLVTEMMVKAVKDGESKFAKPKGYKVAGKTGTAQIPVAGHYDANKTIASFVGFAPAEDPKFVMLVRYDQPTSSIYGSETAAPTFFEIAKELFIYYGISPTELDELQPKPTR